MQSLCVSLLSTYYVPGVLLDNEMGIEMNFTINGAQPLHSKSPYEFRGSNKFRRLDKFFGLMKESKL